MTRFAFGGISAPLVGIAGAAMLLPLGIVTASAVALAVAAYVALMRRPTAPGPSFPAESSSLRDAAEPLRR